MVINTKLVMLYLSEDKKTATALVAVEDTEFRIVTDAEGLSTDEIDMKVTHMAISKAMESGMFSYKQGWA